MANIFQAIQHLITPQVTLWFTIGLALVAGPSALATPCGWNSMLAVTGTCGGIGRVRLANRATLLSLFGLGEVLSASAVGLTLGALGLALRSVAGSVLGVLGVLGAIAALTYAASAIAGHPLRVPTSNWVVPRNWSSYGPHRFVFFFGLALGTGFLTIVPFFGFYLLLLLCCMSGTIAQAVVTMMVFAVARWIPVALATTLMRLAADGGFSVSNMRLVRGLTRWDHGIRWARVVALIMVAPVLLVRTLASH